MENIFVDMIPRNRDFRCLVTVSQVSERLAKDGKKKETILK